MRILWIVITALVWMSCGNNPSQAETERKAEGSAPPELLTVTVDTALAGGWILEALPKASMPFDQLFPRQRPMILIQPELKLISGTTGCNRFSATLTTHANELFIKDLSRSSLVCVGEAEPSFLKAIENSNRFSFRNQNELIWGTDSVTWMVFRKR